MARVQLVFTTWCWQHQEATNASPQCPILVIIIKQINGRHKFGVKYHKSTDPIFCYNRYVARIVDGMMCM